MKLLVVNGILDGNQHTEYEASLETLIKQSEHEIKYFKLRDLNINFCTGCWDCWVKTPGLCVIKDDQEEILKYIPHVDHLIFVSPIILGYESSLIKTFKDRFIPTVHPYVRIHHGEQHHYPRYKHLPNLTFIGIENEMTIQTDRDLIKRTYERVALNFDSKLTQFHTSKDIGGVKNVFSNF